ncbi:alpha-L-fucosidase [Streptomyces sp. NA04227]|uniref:alpha-L-fucosidase n=1 Tax=Streptomyces sp. NA04227 TaxID=2742136 RepID=UPI00159055B8|nr:alpha-L-fucosidase [Streptomyces sp. NA04227]QKW10438.1 alpha-L-fucosidase [Streptomyces sp. NA04227]
MRRKRWWAGLGVVGILAAAVPVLSPAATAQVAQDQAADDYEPTPESLNKHKSPGWFDDAKLGFFIHWGPYSVPAYAPNKHGEASYAEHYVRLMNETGSDTNKRHRQVYGEDFDYDRFIKEWKPDKFKPEEWLKLFEQGGGKYFNLVTKHHDGVALWDTGTTDRSTAALGPRRDLVKELMDAAKDSPLKRGLYYSMIEWYHPVGGQIRKGMVNPYTGKDIPYTGYKPVDDYVMDHQYPQMKELVSEFDPDIVWCDSNGPNNANQFMAEYYNQAKDRPKPKDVAVNDRCGNWIGDFDTPEYTVEPDINPEKWEATRGLGGSFGYNAEEQPEDLLSSDELIDSFVDIVSKNGNLLLNLGPKADGSIPEMQAERVRDLGAWLKINGEAIYGSTYWNHAEDDNSNVPVRYTMKNGALYVTALKWPGEKLTLSGDLPLADNSTIKLLGSDGAKLPFKRTDGKVDITMPAQGASATAGRDAYTFKITTPGVNQLQRTKLSLPAAETGEPVTASVTVSNPSDRPSPDGRVTLDVPQGWTVKPDKVTVEGLAPHASRTVKFTVQAPQDIDPKRYRLTARAAFGRAHYESSQTMWGGVDHFENVAKSTTATQKSEAHGGVPARAVDGNTDGVWGHGSVTHTKEPESEAWWQTDLGSSRDIADIAVWNRKDCCGDRTSNYYVFVSDTPFTSGSVKDTLAQPGVKAYFQEKGAGSPTRIPADTKGRYVRVQLTSTTAPLSLAEVEVLSAVRR